MRRLGVVANGGRTLALQRDPAIEIGNTYAAASMREVGVSDWTLPIRDMVNPAKLRPI
jgi:hypothetical protein